MIDIQHLTKDYDSVKALKGVSFSVRKGSFFALLGPNGAGKSTTAEIISTLKKPTSGKVIVDGETLGENDEAIRRKIGIVFQYSVLDNLLTVRENLMLRGALYEPTRENLKKRIETLKDLIGFADYIDQPFKTLSGGQKRKIDVARALLNNPQYLILDEPTTGLDPSTRENIWALINTLRTQNNMTIILTTHYMEEVANCDDIVIIDHGEIIAHDSAENLRKKHAGDTAVLTPKNDKLTKVLKADKIFFKSHKNTLRIPLKSSFEGIDLIEKYRLHIESFEILKGNMDDVFLNITGRKLNQ